MYKSKFLSTENGQTNNREALPTAENNIQSSFGSYGYNEVRLGNAYNKVDSSKLEMIEHNTTLPAFIRWHDKSKTIGTRYSTDDGVSIHYIDIGYHHRMYLLEGCV